MNERLHDDCKQDVGVSIASKRYFLGGTRLLLGSGDRLRLLLSKLRI
jgi:hypothetical protein